MQIDITRTIPLFPNGVFVQWTITRADEAGDYAFSLFRSGSPNGPWDPLLENQVSAYSYVDRFPTPSVAGVTHPNQLSLSRGIYYKVVARAPSGALTEVVSGVEPRLDGRLRLLKRKILRDEAVMLRKLNGTEVAVLKRKHWGVRCPKCYDKYTKEVVRANCTNCFGTSFVGGYHEPVIVYAKRGVGAPQVGLTPQGNAEVATNKVTLLDLPALEFEDILVFLRDNARFLVKRISPTELQTVVVHQSVEVSELARSDISYRVQVDPVRTPRLF